MNAAIPDCLGALPSSTQPRWHPPAGAWDTHFHVLGPRRQFPYAPDRKYTPPDASFEDCRRMHDQLGIDRGFVVHANTHGFDNRVDLDAIARSNGRYLGVVRFDHTVTTKACELLHTQGVRGVRFAFNPQHGGTLDLAVFDKTIACIEELGWFVELHFDGKAIPELESWLRTIQLNLVIDHIGRVDVEAGVEQPGFRILCDLARGPNVWIKLSGVDRLSRTGYPYDDVLPYVRRLAEIAPRSLLWGTDWPHTGIFDARRMPDDGLLLDALTELVPDEALRCRILVDHPLHLLAGARAQAETIPSSTERHR